MLRGLIFDFDGLILDTEVPDFRAWQEVYQSYGCSLPFSKWATLIGAGVTSTSFDPYDYLEELLGQPIDRAEVRLKRRQRFAALVEAQPLLPGVEHYIDDAVRLGLKLGIASSSFHEWVERHLCRFGLRGHFDCIKCGDDMKNAKPHPDLYLAVLHDLGIRPNQAIAFEDSTNGVLAAKRAGIYCVAVPNTLTRDLPLDGADLVLGSLADLPLEALLKKAGTRKKQSPRPLARESGCPPGVLRAPER